jgi:WD40 repeat protein
LAAPTGQSGNVIGLYDVATGAEKNRLISASRISKMVYSPDGKVLAAAGDRGVIYLWDAATGDQLVAAESGQGPIRDIAFTADGRAVVYETYDSLRICDAASGKDQPMQEVRRSLITPEDSADDARNGQWTVQQTVISPDAKVVARSTQRAFYNGPTPQIKPGGIEIFDVPPTDKYVAARPDTPVTAPRAPIVRAKGVVWEAPKNSPPGRPRQLHLTIDGDQGPVEHLRFSPDGKTLASAHRFANVRLWDAATGKAKGLLPTGECSVAPVFTPDGATLISRSSYTISVWDLGTGRVRFRVENQSQNFVLSPDGATLATSGGSAQLRDVKSGKVMATILGARGGQLVIEPMAFSPDGKMLALKSYLGPQSGESSIRLCDVATGADRAQIPGFKHNIWYAAFSPTGRTLAVAADDTLAIRLYDTTSGQETGKLVGHEWQVLRVAFSPDGKSLISWGIAGPFQWFLWDVATRTEKARSNSLPLAFSSDGKTLTEELEGGSTRKWEVATGKVLEETSFDSNRPIMPIFVDYRVRVAFSPDGKMIARAYPGKTQIQIWNMGEPAGNRPANSDTP